MKKPKTDWENVDWTKTNMQLAFKYGLTSARSVQVIRKKLGKPASTTPPVKWMPFRNHARKAA